ncbi:SNF2 helicase-associated domain-containing protein [Neomoorella thermoacetica]|uniref:SNF2 helicase-associated domain-containing protein n=1 Tax=Neomoorella thermoacetica TaxID=1525 RepID=UPI0004723180|nr:SNF2 helicase-associated domain-containing protein [Moorella thermoacetica]
MPLVRLRGQWVELCPEELESLSRFWREGASTGVVTATEALRLGLARGQVPGREPGPAASRVSPACRFSGWKLRGSWGPCWKS